MKQFELFSKINEIKYFHKIKYFNLFLFFIILFYKVSLNSELHQFGQVQKTIMSGTTIYYNLLLSISTYILIFFTYFYDKYKLGKYLFFSTLVLTLIIDLVSGSKSNVVLTIIVVLLIYKNGALKLKVKYLLGLFFIMFITSIVATLARFNSIANSENFYEKIKSILENLNLDIIYTTLNILTHRFHGIDSLYDMYIYTLEKGYFYGETLYLFFVSFYPRILWPSKPDIAMGVWFGDNVFLVHDTTVSFWLPGEAFLNFGFFGFLFVFIYSVGITLLDKKLHNNNNLFMLMLYIAFFLTIRNQSYTIAASFSGLLKNFIPVVVYIFLTIFIYKLKLRR